MHTDKNLGIRPIKDEDLFKLWELIYKDENPEWKQWDAPYFRHHTVPYEKFLEKGDLFINSESL